MAAIAGLGTAPLAFAGPLNQDKADPAPEDITRVAPAGDSAATSGGGSATGSGTATGDGDAAGTSVGSNSAAEAAGTAGAGDPPKRLGGSEAAGPPQSAVSATMEADGGLEAVSAPLDPPVGDAERADKFLSKLAETRAAAPEPYAPPEAEDVLAD